MQEDGSWAVGVGVVRHMIGKYAKQAYGMVMLLPACWIVKTTLEHGT